MQSTQTPTLIPLAFAANGTKNTIPEASQIGIVDGAASLNDGFPPLTRTPIAAGGKPPSGADMNGILYLVSAPIRWHQAGGKYGFNSAFAADTNVGGYPNGAELLSADMQGTWLSLIDNNTDNPDTGPGTNWVPGRAYGVTAISGLTNANVTLTPAQAAKGKITLAGTLTGNIQIVMPTWLREWTFVNNTTGSGSITVKTASGTGVVLAAGQQKLTGDGTNIVQPIENDATPAQFDNSSKRATTSWVNGRGMAYGGQVVLSSLPATLTAEAHAGKEVTVTSPGAITMPLASTVANGSVIGIFNYSTGAVSVTRNGSDQFEFLQSATSVSLAPGDSVVLMSDGTGVWIAVGGSMPLAQTGVFASLLGISGYKKIPDKNSPSGFLLLQWGSVSSSGTADVTTTYPIAFPNGIMHVYMTGDYTVGTGALAYYNAATQGSLTNFVSRASASVGSRYLAIGY